MIYFRSAFRNWRRQDLGNGDVEIQTVLQNVFEYPTYFAVTPLGDIAFETIEEAMAADAGRFHGVFQ